MDHVAIMKKSWGLTEKILNGEKTVESRWYKFKYPPWGRIKVGDEIYFKDSGEPVTIKAHVVRVLEFDNLTLEKTEYLLSKYGRADLGTSNIMPEIRKYVVGKKYAIFIFFDDIKKIKPFNIDKAGFGTMSSWISINDISKIKMK